MPELMLLGADHRVAPSNVRDRLAVSRAELGGVLSEISASTSVREVFALSTFNQTEFYLRGLPAALNELRLFWQERAGVAGDGLEASLYMKRDGEAVSHLFALSTSLDALTPAASSTLRQIKDSLLVAREAGTIGGYLDALLTRALRMGRLVQREFGVAPNPEQLTTAREMVKKEADRFMRWARSKRAATAIAAMTERAEDIRRAELLKMEAKLRHLNPEQREALEALTMSIVDKLLHPSKRALKEAAGLKEASDYLQAASELFDLDEK